MQQLVKSVEVDGAPDEFIVIEGGLIILGELEPQYLVARGGKNGFDFDITDVFAYTDTHGNSQKNVTLSKGLLTVLTGHSNHTFFTMTLGIREIQKVLL